MRTIPSVTTSGMIASALWLYVFALNVTTSHGQGSSLTEEQLKAVATTYVLDGLGGKSFDAIPYAEDVSLRAPIGPNGSWTPFAGIDALRSDWWAPLPGILGDVRLIDTYVNESLDGVTAEFHLDLQTDPQVTLRIIDRFAVNGDGKITSQENFFDPRDLTLTERWRAGPTDTGATPRRGTSIDEQQLRDVAKIYIIDGLNGKSFEAIPFAENASLRAPIGPNGSWTPFEGIESLLNDWWPPLPGLLGEVRLVDTFVNTDRDAVTAEFHLGLNTDPPVALRIVDRFVVNGDGEIIEQENFFDPRDLTNPWRGPSSGGTVFNWTSEGTFDASMLPAGSAENTFSNSSPFELNDVHFHHTVAATDDLSELRLFDGTFEITTDSGDVLLGIYQDFIYRAQEDGSYVGTGDFLFDGGTGSFQNVTGSGSWTAVAGFTSQTGGTADHVWSGTLSGIVTLMPGDADQDLAFDQTDLVQVQQAAKYLSGQPASWGEGDWNGAPGGWRGNPPTGDGRFNQLDIIAAQQGGTYQSGTYAAVQTGGIAGDGQASIGYDARSGEVWVDAPAGVELTSVNIDSAVSIFTGESAMNLGGSFDNDADNNIFKATFGSSFGSLSFGNVARSGLTEEFLLNDLTVIGSLSGGGDLGDVDLIYVPEPSTLLLAGISVCLSVACIGRRNRG